MSLTVDVRALVGEVDFVWLVFDSLRFDVASAALRDGDLPTLSAWLPGGFERRHTPGTFTFPAHQAFFAGFLPTPTTPGPHARPFVCAFPGSESVGPGSLVLDAPDVPAGLAGLGYRTIAVGGTGFFNPTSPVGAVLPGLFQTSFWETRTGVTDPDSATHAVQVAVEQLVASPGPTFLFINFAATHQPTTAFVPGATQESPQTQQAAFSAVDAALLPLFAVLQQRRPAHVIVMSDHGTLHGEDGLWGHRIAHPLVLDVPYAEFVLPVAP